ncbi:ParA family protein [Leifsonia sp. NPDC102414]|uniref:ParA family protein n=1 Tax=Leifsonia sp. NPDC102414 TaxID=3364124 RepID=UPI0038306703
MSIARACAIENGKGGVGKTSIICNVGGLAAADGARVLIVDLDPQNNTSKDLGYPMGDGAALFNAFVTDAPLPILRNVRPNLDVVVGGEQVGDIPAMSFAWSQRGAGDFADRLHAKLDDIAGEYDLILIDTPPGDRIISEGVLVVATSVVIPTQSDDGSLDGVMAVAKRFLAVRDRNPELQLAGVVLFDMEHRAMRLERGVRRDLEEMLGGVAPVFQRRIRHAKSPAKDARARGLLAHELEDAADADRKQRLVALRAGEKPVDGMYTRDATGLAEDYQELTREIIRAVARIQAEVDAA